MGPYLDSPLEELLEIKFADPRTEDLQGFVDDLETAAAYLGEKVGYIDVPDKGFLVSKLTEKQREAINLILGEKYAAVNSRHQEKLKSIPIEECGEPMVSLTDVKARAGLDVGFSDEGFHKACSSYAGKPRIWYVRKQVAEKFIAVCRAFNAINVRPYIEDAWRPAQVQEGLLLRRVVDLAQKHDWNEEGVRAVAMSLTAPSPGLAGHQAGAALDVSLMPRAFPVEEKKFFEIGNNYADGDVICCINCPYVTKEQYVTRMKFAHVMRMGGFRLLPTENWHVSDGDRGMGIDGPVPIEKAIYGPISSFDFQTGEIIPYRQEDIEQPYLTSKQSRDLIRRAWRWKNAMTNVEIVEKARHRQLTQKLFSIRSKNGVVTGVYDLSNDSAQPESSNGEQDKPDQPIGEGMENQSEQQDLQGDSERNFKEGDARNVAELHILQNDMETRVRDEDAEEGIEHNVP
jgi:D-alanyl-D-alanine dipeptidase